MRLSDEEAVETTRSGISRPVAKSGGMAAFVEAETVGVLGHRGARGGCF